MKVRQFPQQQQRQSLSASAILARIQKSRQTIIENEMKSKILLEIVAKFGFTDWDSISSSENDDSKSLRGSSDPEKSISGPLRRRSKSQSLKFSKDINVLVFFKNRERVPQRTASSRKRVKSHRISVYI